MSVLTGLGCARRRRKRRSGRCGACSRRSHANGRSCVRLEDIHWAEPTLLDLVEYVVGWCRDAAILVLCLARPELLDERPDWLGVRGTSLTLEPLTGEESDELLDVLDVPLEAGARARIRDAAEGNPLFVEQMVAMLAEAPGETAMPPTINALLAARLDRLAPLDRSILERASVLGQGVRARRRGRALASG